MIKKEEKVKVLRQFLIYTVKEVTHTFPWKTLVEKRQRIKNTISRDGIHHHMWRRLQKVEEDEEELQEGDIKEEDTFKTEQKNFWPLAAKDADVLWNENREVREKKRGKRKETGRRWMQFCWHWS